MSASVQNYSQAILPTHGPGRAISSRRRRRYGRKFALVPLRQIDVIEGIRYRDQLTLVEDLTVSDTIAFPDDCETVTIAVRSDDLTVQLSPQGDKGAARFTALDAGPLILMTETGQVIEAKTIKAGRTQAHHFVLLPITANRDLAFHILRTPETARPIGANPQVFGVNQFAA